MKPLIFTLMLILSASSWALSESVVLRLVKEDIASETLIRGKRYVDSLKIRSCDDSSCLLDYEYFASGCYYDYCYDLQCNGLISFDLNEVESEIKSESCIDL
ncbi:MAG: hypothetical protein K9K67_09335 [Bacteriovoracaceae bacterium]|nr:hypothetical protein [Bacteriovoracaceae bacterium]